jgi:hypothetical protein
VKLPIYKCYRTITVVLNSRGIALDEHYPSYASKQEPALDSQELEFILQPAVHNTELPVSVCNRIFPSCIEVGLSGFSSGFDSMHVRPAEYALLGLGFRIS